MSRQPSRDEFRYEFWKESSEFWQEQTKALKAKNEGKFRRAVLIAGFSFVLGAITGMRQ